MIDHEVWQDEDGKTMLCFTGKRGDDARSWLEPNSKVIYTFLASSHFEAMTKYYQFMQWGTYETLYEIDKQPYQVDI